MGVTDLQFMSFNSWMPFFFWNFFFASFIISMLYELPDKLDYGRRKNPTMTNCTIEIYKICVLNRTKNFLKTFRIATACWIEQEKNLKLKPSNISMINTLKMLSGFYKSYFDALLLSEILQSWRTVSFVQNLIFNEKCESTHAFKDILLNFDIS